MRRGNETLVMESPTRINNKLLLLGVLSLFFLPFTAIPGIVIGRRQKEKSTRGKVGYILCWSCMVVFSIHLMIVGTMIIYGICHNH